jgi:hypothetical protein
MAKWLDKYENGGEYLGTTNVGRNYSPAWGGQFQMGGNIQPPMAGANQTLPMYQMGGYVYPVNYVPQAQMGASLPGSVGFTYARTGSTPSEGPYAKKTLPSAQDGRTLLGTLSNFIPYYETYVDAKDVVMGGLTGDRARMNQGILGLGAPFAGKALTSGLDYVTEKGLGKDVADYNETKRNDITNMSQNDRQKLFEKYGAGGYDKWVKAGKPKLQHGGEMSFYQHGLDWTPRNISEYGSEIPMAQGGEDVPYWMKRSSDISQRGNQNLKTEIAAQKTKEKKAQAARERTTIGADTRTAKQKEKDRQAYESKLKYEKEVLGKDFETPQYLQEKNRARAEHLIHLADVGSMGAGLVEGIGKLALKNVPKPTSVSSSVDNVGTGVTNVPIGNIFSSNKNSMLDDWMIEEMRFSNLPELNNSNATEVLENFKKRISTPEGQRRLKELGITETEVFDKLKIVADKNGLAQYWLNKIGIHPELPEVKRVTRHEIEHGVQDAYKRSKLKKANKFKWSDLFGNTKRSERVYEALGDNTTDIDKSLQNLELRKTPENVDWDMIKETRDKQDASELFKYMSDKQKATNYFTSGSQGREKSAFLGEVQQYMMDKGIIPTDSYVNITPEMVENVFMDAMFDEKGGGKYLRLFNIMKPTENNYKLLSEGLNKMLSITPYIGIGAGLSGAAALQQKKQGGVVKDNMGYWNPDNWGKVVEIDSPNITMKGVNQDLIGISDEGDVQYMEPGKDYKFKGKKVKEYPVAKYGVNQQDEKTAQHLDQLLNFTNYNKPTKGGWLDKY